MVRRATGRAQAGNDQASQTISAMDALLSISSGAVRGSDLKPIERVKTGIITLDAMYGGGIPKGRSIEIYGPESSGKTTVSLHICAAFQRVGITPLYLDIEATLEPEHMLRSGIDLNRIVVLRPTDGSEAFSFMNKGASAGAGVIVTDSIPGLVPKGDMEKFMNSSDDKAVAGVAAMFARQWPVLVQLSRTYNTTFIFLNQMSAKISPMAMGGLDTPGGWRRKHLMSHRLYLKYAAKDKAKPGVIETTAVVEKSKVGSAGMTGTITIDHGSINPYSCLLSSALDTKLAKTSGSWIKFTEVTAETFGIENIGQGFDRAVSYLQENPNVADQLYDMCLSLQVGGVIDLPDEEDEDEEEAGGVDE